MEVHEATLIRAAEELTGLENPYPKDFGTGGFLTADDCRGLATDALFYHTLLCVAEAIRRALNQHHSLRDEFPASFIAPYARSRDREVQELAQRLLGGSGAVLRKERARAVKDAMCSWAQRDGVTR